MDLATSLTDSMFAAAEARMDRSCERLGLAPAEPQLPAEWTGPATSVPAATIESVLAMIQRNRPKWEVTLEMCVSHYTDRVTYDAAVFRPRTDTNNGNRGSFSNDHLTPVDAILSAYAMAVEADAALSEAA